MRRTFSRPLIPGMTIGLIAPASPVYEPERRSAAVQLLTGLGFHVVKGITVDEVDYCFAGNDETRARDFMNMFLNDDIDAVVCLRGGYGSQRLLHLLDFKAIRMHPKPFVGFSDITALHLALIVKCGFVTFHGPMPGLLQPYGLRQENARNQWLNVLSGQQGKTITNPDGTPFSARGAKIVEGRLIGGNLSLLCSLVGTPYEPNWDGALILIEDVAQRTAQLDSMMEKLQECNIFRRAAGLIVGDFSHYDGMTTPRMLPLSRIIVDHIPARLPVLFNVHAGHGRDRMTLAMNIRYRLNPMKATLTRLENPFKPLSN